MATPKKKISRSRRNMRRFSAGNALDTVTGSFNAEIGEYTRPHRVSKNGLYNGKQIFTRKTKDKTNQANETQA